MKKLISSVKNIIYRRSASFDWAKVITKSDKKWDEFVSEAKNGRRILIATSMGCYDAGLVLESLISVALTLRGAELSFFLCDDLLSVCQMAKISSDVPARLVHQGKTQRCHNCFKSGREFYQPLGLNIFRFSEFVSKAEITKAEDISSTVPLAQIKDYEYEGLSVGEHAYAGVLRYYGRGELENDSYCEKISRMYLRAAMLTVFATRGLLKKHKFDCVVFHHGIYVPQGLIGEVLRQEGVRVINWNHAYRKQSFIFSHNDSYHHTMISEPVSAWENIKWTPEIEDKTLKYLKSRWQGTDDWIWFHEKPVEDVKKIAKELGIDFNKPCVGMLTNVMWDAQLHYQSNAFKCMLDWVFQTIEYFVERPDLQLIIRIHPAEIRGLVPSRQKLADEINKKYKILPENIFIILPESQVSTYAVMEKCNAVLIYNTKTGIELASLGIPVVVAGEAWIRNKGFSLDASNPNEYFKILNRLPLPERMGKEQTQRALKYAFHFFFRRMLQVPYVVMPKKLGFTLSISSLKDLMPGMCRCLDLICQGILTNSAFIYDAENAR